MRRLAVLILALLFVFPWPAEARSRKRSSRRPNMPIGWVWPPSKRMKGEGKRCLKELTRLGVRYRKAKRRRRVATPIVLRAMEIAGVKLVPLWRKPPFVMDCHLALAFAEEGAPALRTLGVKELRFSSIYAWREVAGKGALSRHALGLAMDVFSFVTDDDVVREVETEYAKADPVLLGVEKAIAATGSYRMLLTPGNDPRHHHDHFHFEARAPREKVVIPAVTMPSVPPATP